MNTTDRRVRYDFMHAIVVALLGLCFNGSFVFAEDSISLEKLVVAKEKTFTIDKKTYEVEVRILPDLYNQPDVDAAKTTFELKVITPGYSSSASKYPRVTKYQNKVQWKLILQTAYGKGKSPKTPSGYGRGTTEADLKSDNVLLGFHEYCHRQDYIEYVKTRGLTDFGLKRGILVVKHNQIVDPKNLNTTATTFSEKMTIYSVEKTDEVGQVKRSEFLKRGGE
ncbi:MAG: hypothetical protein ACKVH8_21000 [Pirellulales bacterium]